jgi:hypothetical protein
MGTLVNIAFVVSLGMAYQTAVAQPVQQNELSKPSGVVPEERQTPQELQRFYERYFVEVCQKTNRCDGSCKEVFDLLENKETLKLRCP